MTKQTFDINKLRVASPCSVGWETMSGDERVRHCNSCQLNIYNITEMTENEVEDLIANREDRLCIRLYKRADGTVLTKDCPIGFRAYQKRTARFAGAALTAILGLFSVSFGQKDVKKNEDDSIIRIVRTINVNQPSSLGGIIKDQTGALIPKVEIKIYKDKKKKIKVKSNEDGVYNLPTLPAGTYFFEVKSVGFKTYKIPLIISANEQIKLDLMLKTEGSVTVGIYTEEPLIDTTSSSVTTILTQKMIDRLPH
ncbi:MAG: carboxypeptidase-like regulatory domain-containing protein [Actinomycetota bacterium]